MERMEEKDTHYILESYLFVKKKPWVWYFGRCHLVLRTEGGAKYKQMLSKNAYELYDPKIIKVFY